MSSQKDKIYSKLRFIVGAIIIIALFFGAMQYIATGIFPVGMRVDSVFQDDNAEATPTLFNPLEEVILGTYQIDGANPDGSTYKGVLNIR